VYVNQEHKHYSFKRHTRDCSLQRRTMETEIL